jgi:dCMP deaminase
MATEDPSLEKASKYLKIAQLNAALFSKDKHHKVGALILSRDFSSILSTGINGFCRGMDDSSQERWERPMKDRYICHAEQNCLMNCCRDGIRTKDAIMITTLFPCSVCCRSIVQAGISKIYSPRPNLEHERWGEEFKLSIEIFNEVMVDIIYLN